MDHRLFIIALIVASGFICVIASNPSYKYVIDNGVTINLLNKTIISDVSPYTYLSTTNKNDGIGFTIGVNNDTNLYSELSTYTVKSTTANYTYYFYKDKNKFYIRDSNCNFLCVNSCGSVFLSHIRYRHFCKFNIKKIHNKYSIYAGNHTNRVLEFKKDDNLLKAKIVSNTNNFVDENTLFILKNEPKPNPTKCVQISKTEQKLLAKDQRCQLNTILNNTVSLSNIDVFVKKDNKKYYKLLMKSSEYDKVFIKHFYINNVYVLQDVNTCKYLCQNEKCGVYMSNENTEECKIKIDQGKSDLFIRFNHSNYYLTYNSMNDSMTFSNNKKTFIKFVETDTPHVTKHCQNYEPINKKQFQKCPVSNNGNSFMINLPSLLIFLALNYKL
ncbi:FGF-2 [Choristoneura occidentalis granulovirus]|uniref:FGF-2 n=1 Tax=Choristoneura occidentalis granulovirus TaxID=364745 RepID=Q1A4J4_9BBAC|nr:FGF-2 [Choristoneura fumiferana granulovirus]ABC61236.1 FGF-2 [Choristoneura fumiferana granulovirus]